MKKEGPRKLYVGSLDYNITEDLLVKIFQAFGDVEKITIQRDEAGQSKGFGFVDVSKLIHVLMLSNLVIVLLSHFSSKIPMQLIVHYLI